MFLYRVKTINRGVTPKMPYSFNSPLEAPLIKAYLQRLMPPYSRQMQLEDPALIDAIHKCRDGIHYF